MRIELTPQIDAREWADLAEADPAATVFHAPDWVEAFTHALPYAEPLYVLARDDAGYLTGGIPAVRSTRMGLTQLLAQPYGTYGTPLARRPGVREALIRRWIQETRRPGVVRAHLVDFDPRSDIGNGGTTGIVPSTWRQSETTHLADLSPGSDALWSSLPGSVRSACRKAERAGVVVERGTTSEDLQILNRLYQSQAETWSHHTPFPSALFARLRERAPEMTGIWLARRDEKPLAASLVLYDNRSAVSWITVLAPEGRETRAGVLLDVRIVKDAAANGLATFDFGSSRGVAALESFKESLGGRPVSYPSHLYQASWFTPLHRTYYRLTGKT